MIKHVIDLSYKGKSNTLYKKLRTLEISSFHQDRIIFKKKSDYYISDENCLINLTQKTKIIIAIDKIK